MDSDPSDASDLIRKLSRRQWTVSLAVVALTLGSLLLGWQGLVEDEQSAEMVNFAGRQRMLSQRMAMYVVLQEREPDEARRRQYRDMAKAAAEEFAKAQARLAANAKRLGASSPIHAMYFGPAGTVDTKSLRYLAEVRAAMETAVSGKPGGAGNTATIVAASANGLIEDLNRVTALYQREAEQKIELILRLIQLATLLIVGLVVFGMLAVFRPAIRRLASDVAARDQAQRDLKQSEERFRAFSESSSDWFWETDTQHRFTWIKEGNAMRAFLSLERLVGKTRLELRSDIEKLAVEKWRSYEADLAAHRSFRDIEYQITSDDGHSNWISVSGQPFFDARGNFLGYRGTTRNIQAQKDIEASMQRLQLAIEQSPVSIAITDADGTIIFVNAHFSAISGYSAEEAVGQRAKSLLWSEQTPKSVYADLQTALNEGKTWRGEVSARGKSGALYWENLSVSPVRDQYGQATYYIAVSEDITAQRAIIRREKSRQRILEVIAHGAPLPEPLNLMVAMAEAELPGGICTILRRDPLRGTLHSACGSSLSADFAAALEGLPVAEGAGSCGTAAATATRVVVENIETHPHCQRYRELAAADGLRACWSQPILSSAGKVLGTLAIYYRTPRSPAPEEIQVIELVSSLVAICLERDEAEQALRWQEKQTRKLLAENESILGNALVGIVYLKHRRVVSCNRRLEEIFGYEPGELIGESSERFYYSRKTFEAIGRDAYRVSADVKNFSTELMLKRKDGTPFRGALTGRVIDPENPQEGSIWIYADISERYQAEQQVHKLLQAVEQSPASIVITDRDGLIEYVNPRFTKVTGYAATEALGQNPRILKSGETPLETYRTLWQTILAGREWRGVMRNRRKDGELFWEEASISPIFGEKGEITHFLAVKEDITERKRIEDELDQHRAHLENLVEKRTADLSAALEAAKAGDRAKDAFLANVSHELRTPLNAVIGLSELARRISTNPRQQDYLDKVASAGKNLAAIINDLLDLSKVSAGHMEFESTSFSLRALARRCHALMAHRATGKGVELTERIDDAVPDVLVGDPLRVEQILMNLLSNAIKFTPAGRVELRIGVHALTEKRVCLGIEVEDTGIGLSEESIARLFQPFAQADASMNRQFGGTGLGLALCKRLAEMMNGDIGATSGEGVGTTFHVRLWLELGDTADLPDETRAADEDALPASYRDAQVLVVDDQPLNREIVEALLIDVGIVPRMASNGKEAFDIVKAAGPQGFDLVLMDIQMPIMDGLVATREIRRMAGYERLPLVAMTAHTLAHEKEISVAAGMNDHIGKPFETTSFFKMLARWIPAAKQCMASDTRISSPPARAATGLAALRSIDTKAGLARFAGNEARYRHWLTEFLAEAPAYAPRIRQAVAAGDLEAARQSAHAIKGRVGMLGMTTMHPISAALESALMQGAPADALIEQMDAAVAALCAEIRAALETPVPAPASQPAMAARPLGEPPESLNQVIVMLKCADGGSEEMIERCLSELKDTDWAPRLRQALAHVRSFDFDAARVLLAPDDQRPHT